MLFRSDNDVCDPRTDRLGIGFDVVDDRLIARHQEDGRENAIG